MGNKKINVNIATQKVGELFYEKENNLFVFNYTEYTLNNSKNNPARQIAINQRVPQGCPPISLIMPYKNSSYIWHNRLHPIFDMNMPEGYLFEIIKKYIMKEYGFIDDFLIFSYLCGNIKNRLTFDSCFKKSEFLPFNLNNVLNNDSEDTFAKIVKTFLGINAISGVQPKTLALLEDEESLTTKEYIIKTWGDEYPELALNEYFCLKAVEKTGVKIPNIMLSKNNKFLVVERFNYDKKHDSFLGFEEVLVLLGKNKEQKYDGSYENIAKVIYSVSTDKLNCMRSLYKVIVMNYLLKNGDGHLKNFGVLYDKDFKNIYFSPAYDVVNTVVYFHKDKPALTMFGEKVWFGKKELVKFALIHCYMPKTEASTIYDSCINSLKDSIIELKEYINKNNEFKIIGQKMIDIWCLSLDGKTYRRLHNEISRNR